VSQQKWILKADPRNEKAFSFLYGHVLERGLKMLLMSNSVMLKNVPNRTAPVTPKLELMGSPLEVVCVGVQ
jgi:hypothetical protein